MLNGGILVLIDMLMFPAEESREEEKSSQQEENPTDSVTNVVPEGPKDTKTRRSRKEKKVGLSSSTLASASSSWAAVVGNKREVTQPSPARIVKSVEPAREVRKVSKRDTVDFTKIECSETRSFKYFNCMNGKEESSIFHLPNLFEYCPEK